MLKGKPKKIRITLTAIGALALILIGAFCVYRVWERPPEVAEPTATAAPATAEPEATLEPLPEGEALETQRKDGVYTILLAGLDQVSGNTDTILLGKLDTKKHSMDFVSLPRDTLINVDWHPRKLNAVYAGSLNNDGTGVDALLLHVKWLTGIEADCYAVADLDVFMKAVDAIGGVSFDVPSAIDYDDYGQNLFIHLQPGPQVLNGYQAMGFCRYREGFITGDLGRIEMQHAFLKACADQLISLGSLPHAREVIQLVADGVQTDLSAANIAWFLRQAAQCKSEDVNFHTLPTEACALQGYSYAVVRLSDWVTLLNEHLNPYEDPITTAAMNLVFWRGTDDYGCTGAMAGPWYFVKPTPTPAPTPAPPKTDPTPGPRVTEVIVTPAPTPAPTAAPTPEPTPAPTPEPTPEPTPAPTPEPTPAPTPEPAPEAESGEE